MTRPGSAIPLLCAMVLGADASSGQPPMLPRYVGQAECLRCHGNAGSARTCALEPIEAHEHAYDALSLPPAEAIAALCGERDPPTRSRLCLACHAAGADDGPRWWEPAFRLTDGVQCEACHGPGSVHRDAAGGAPRTGPMPPAPAIRLGDRGACATCHMDRASHREVLSGGFRLREADRLYRTPVNLAVSPDGTLLYVACEGSNSVAVVDVERRKVLRDMAVGRRPHDLALSPDGRMLYVTNRLGGSISVFDVPHGAAVGEIAVGAEPHGILVTGSGRRVWVCNTAEDSVSVLNMETMQEVKRLVAGRRPWSIAASADQRYAYVTSLWPDPAPFLAAPRSEITVIDIEGEVVVDRRVAEEANMLQGVASAGETVLLTLHRTKNLIPATHLLQGWMVTNGIGVLGPDGRLDQLLLDEPTNFFSDPMDIAASPDGTRALVTSGGGDEVAVVDVAKLRETIAAYSDAERRTVLPNHLGTSERFVIRRIAVGANPRGVVFSPPGDRAFIACALDDSVTVLDIATGTVAGSIRLGGPEEVTELRRGERLFHSAAITFGRQFSCRTCHPDGHINGLTFDIEADVIGISPVDNRTLRGILDTAPFKWEGTNPSLHRQCGPRFAAFFTRLAPYPPAELNALVRYMCTIEQPPNRFRQPNGLTPAQRRGKAIFERTVSNDGRALARSEQCASCHRGVYATDRSTADVGTTMWLDAPVPLPPQETLDPDEYGELGSYYFIDAGVSTRRFDVPHLRNIYDSPPFLHNGASATLEEIWTRFNMVQRHGATGDLTREQYNDLIAYLKAL